METYNLSQFPAPYSTVHIALFENVRNSPDIRKRLIAASVAEGPEGEAARADIDFGFIEGRLIVSREHLMVAIMATLLTSLATSTSDSSPVLKTRSHNLHSEILLALSPNNNISDSIRRHGIANETDHLVVVRFGGDGSQGDVEAVWRGMAGVVDGDLVSVDKLDQGEQIDWSRIDKIFKLSEIDRLTLTETEKHAKKVAAIISTVAVKHVT